MDGSTNSTNQGPGTGLPYVRWLDVEVGEKYYIAIDRPYGGEEFQMNWIGSAMDGDGAFPDSPEVEDGTLEVCSSQGTGLFTESDIINELNTSGEDYDYRSFDSFADAMDGVNELFLGGFLSTSQPVEEKYVRFENSVSGCFTIAKITLKTYTKPDLNDAELLNQQICLGDEFVINLEGSSEATIYYDIKDSDGNIISEDNVINLDENGEATITETSDEGVIIELTEIVIGENESPVCSRDLDDVFEVEVLEVEFENDDIITIQQCANAEDEIYFFDLGENSELHNLIVQAVLTDITEVDFEFYESEQGAENADEGELIDASQPFETNQQQTTIWVRVANEIGCYAIKQIDLEINYNPELEVDELTLMSCVGDSFDLIEEIIPELVSNPEDYNFEFYSDEISAEEGNPDNQIENPEEYSPSGEETVYVRIQEEGSDCYVVFPVDLMVMDGPEIGDLEDINHCDDYGNGISTFSLIQNTGNAIPDGEDPNEYTITYYTSETDAQAEENAIVNPDAFENTENPQTIFVRVQKDGLDCFGVGSFQIEVMDSGIANQPEDLVMCNLDDGDNIYDLTEVIDEVLGDQDADEFNIGFFETENQAANDTNEIDNPGNYIAQNENQTIWVRIENAENEECFNLTSFDLLTTPVSIGEDLPKLEVCYDETMTEITFDLTENQNPILDGQSALDYNVTYYNSQNDALDDLNPIDDPSNYTTSPELETIWVRVDANQIEDCFEVGSFEIEGTLADPINHDLSPLQVCDTDNDGFYPEFDLTEKDEEVTLGDDTMDVTYHLTQSDANNGVNPIESPYANINPYSQVVYVRVEQENGCELFTELTLEVYDSPQLLWEIDPIELCEINDGEGFADFDLTIIDDQIFQDPSEDPGFYDITYHLSQEDADNDENPIPNPGAFTNLEPGEQTIWVRVESPDGPGCYDTIAVDLIVHPIPEAVQPDPLEVCDDEESGSTDDEISIFDLTVKNEEIKGGDNSLSIIWFETPEDEENDLPIADPTAYANTENAQTIVARVTNEWGCSTTVTLTLVVDPVPTPTPAEELEPYVVCDDNNDGYGIFDLSSQDDYIINDEQNVEVTYHATEEAAEAGTPELPNDYVNITPDEQVIYARLTNIDTGCYAWTELTLEVVPAPEMPNELEDIFACGIDGEFAILDLTQNEDDIFGDQDPEDYEVSYYETEDGAIDGTNPIGHPEAYEYEGPGPDTIWVRLEATHSEGNACMVLGSFEIQAGEELEIFHPEPLAVCDTSFEVGNDETGLFDLTLAIPEITGGNNSYLVEFFETQEDLDNDEPIENPQEYVNINNAQTLIVRVTSSEGCEAFTTLTIQVFPEPNVADELADMEVCDVDNNGFSEFDLASEIEFILNGQPNVNVSFHLTEAGAETDTQTIDHEAGPFENSVPWEQTIWVRVENTGSDDIEATGCFVIRPLTLRVIESPEIQDLEDLYVCDDGDQNGFAVFDLTVNYDNIFGGQPAPEDVEVTYHESQENAEAGTNAIAVPTNYINITNPQIGRASCRES